MQVPRKLYGWPFLSLTFMLLALGGLLASCQPAVETEVLAQAEGTCPVPVQEIEPMNSTENKATAPRKYGIPPIDAVVPGQTMMATFSLG
jgi:hypothetical protein